ncbi:MAG: chemotaxis response regulator protein-glutamate methylesterase [Candidatus Riflebacteria bacterium]|nr:chemotaxis response regulator protein-glutamate methylesterase [Candidatus Riflebacteria bacterium]
MTEKKIKVVVVDDSAFMRTAIERMIKSDPSIEIVGSASNGVEAIEIVLRLKPDVVTMDIEMPVMDGLQALKEIMRVCPTPVLMVSSLTNEGAKITLDALDLGAVDYIPKPGSTLSASILSLKDELTAKISAAAGSKPRHLKLDFLAAKRNFASEGSKIEQYIRRAIFIGASTGGPPAVQKILSGINPLVRAPIIIAQHMPQAFTSAFASRMNSLCAIRVKEASNGEIVQNSVAYVCPGDNQTEIERTNEGTYRFVITPGNPNDEAFAPCIDTLFSSAASVFGAKATGIILTGMGSDGALGLKKIQQAGGFTIAQNQATSVVYGMPKAAIEADAAGVVVSIDDIAAEIELALKKA